MSRTKSLQLVLRGAIPWKMDRSSYFEEIYKNNNARVRRALFWLVGADALDDLVQETFVRVWRALPTFRKESSPSTWVYRIAISTAYDFLRKQKSKELPYMVAEDSAHSSVDVVLNDKWVIHEAIDTLSPEMKSVFVLYYKEEFSLEEIARLLEIPTGTVKSRLHSARNIVVDFLRKKGVRDE